MTRVLAFVALVIASAMSQAQRPLIMADTIYIHGDIYTGVVGASSFHVVTRATTLAVKADRILAIGGENDVLKHKGPDTAVVDFRGHFVMPGFNDAHMHLTEAGFKKLTVDLTGARSLQEFQERLRKRLDTTPRQEWITGSGWDETLWQGSKLPTRWDIDEVVSDHPVFLVRIDGHVAVANTLALKIAHVTLASKEPNGGEIARDGSGEPNGILRETAQELVASLIPPPTPEKHRQAIEAALQDIARSGVTSAQDFSGDNGDSSRANFKILEQLEREGKLSVRISEWLPFNESVETLKQLRDSHAQSDPMLHTGMLKAFMYGSLGSHTSAMLSPLRDDPKNSGLPQYEQAKLNEMTKGRVEAGFQLGFHAIGDKAGEMALDAFAEAQDAARAGRVKAQDGSDKFRLRVEHAQVTNPTQVERFRELNVIASMQPNHLLTDM